MQNTKTLRRRADGTYHRAYHQIHTTATDKDGNKELEAGKEVTIIDTVTLGGLEVGTQYKLVGWQMLKEENAELLSMESVWKVITPLLLTAKL